MINDDNYYYLSFNSITFMSYSLIYNTSIYITLFKIITVNVYVFTLTLLHNIETITTIHSNCGMF